MIEARDLGDIRVLCMAHGKANILDTELLVSLDDALARAAAESTRALVLTGSGNIFSAGVDLFRVLDGGKAYLETFLPALSKSIRGLFTFPKPVIAAVNGHAIAGGCILACACDYRIGVHGEGRIGVPELRVGVPFPAAAFEVVRFAVGNRALREVVFGGGTYLAEEALPLGLLDRIVDSRDLLDSAAVEARRLSDLGDRTFTFSKAQARRKTVAAIRREAERSDAEVLAMWQGAETQARIRRYLDQTLRRQEPNEEDG